MPDAQSNTIDVTNVSQESRNEITGEEILEKILNLKNISWLLGYYLDGWADLVEGMGDKATVVQNGIIDQLNQRGMPDIKVENISLREGFLSSSFRAYIQTKTDPGAKTIVYIDKRGNDLYSSWRSFIRPTINWRLILIYGLLSFGITLFLFVANIIFGLSTVLARVIMIWNWKYSTIIFFAWYSLGLAISLIWMLLVSIIASFRKGYKSYMESSPFWLGHIMAFFVNGFGKTMQDGIRLFLSKVVEGMKSITNPYPIIPTTLEILGAFLVLAALMGLLLRKNIWTFILKEPSIFDAEDITAMNLSVHQSIIRSLDNAGVDITKLRIKQRFSGGRRGEDV